MFARDGFDQVTMQAIAVAAGISQRTLFREFPSKADLAWEPLREGVDAIRRRAEAVARRRAPLGEMVDEIVLGTVRDVRDPELIAFARHHLRVLTATPALLNHPMLDDLRQSITGAIAQSSTLGDRPPALVAEAVVAVASAAAMWWALQDGDGTLADAIEVAIGAVAEGRR